MALHRIDLDDLDALLEELAVSPRPAPPADPLERRACPRFVPLEHRAWLIREGDERDGPTPARLLDIGRGGALVEGGQAFAIGAPLTFCLAGAHSLQEFIPAWVVGAMPGVLAPHRLRLEFQAPCPEHVLERAVRGPVAERGIPYDSPDGRAAGGVVFLDPAGLFPGRGLPYPVPPRCPGE